MRPKFETNNLIKKYKTVLRKKILCENYFDCLSSEFLQLSNLMKRTVDRCDSDSVLLIGPNGCGKSSLLKEALKELKSCKNKEFLVVSLNGLVHIDDNTALKDIIRQLNVNVDDYEKFSGSFSDNLQYLLENFRGGERDTKPLIFILEEFHLFCSHRNQTLLYNLFDSIQSFKGICVIGITSRLDVTEMLEKRVKSRFSHRQLLLLNHPTIEQRIDLFTKLLTLSSDQDLRINSNFLCSWNENIKKLAAHGTVIQILKRNLDLDGNQMKFRLFLMMLVSRLSEDHKKLDVEDIKEINDNVSIDDKIILLQGLSVLEICLIIAMAHQHEIFDGEPFNFEMIIGRYLKFAYQNSAVQITQRPVILKAFERIKSLELIAPVGNLGKNTLKEFQLYNFLLTKDQVTSAVNKYNGLPTDVSQWALNSFV